MVEKEKKDIVAVFGKEVFNAVADSLAYLYARWQDEKEYEDFEEYKNEAKKILPTNCEFKKMTKNPFELIFIYENVEHHIRVNSRVVSSYYRML